MNSRGSWESFGSWCSAGWTGRRFELDSNSSSRQRGGQRREPNTAKDGVKIPVEVIGAPEAQSEVRATAQAITGIGEAGQQAAAGLEQMAGAARSAGDASQAAFRAWRAEEIGHRGPIGREVPTTQPVVINNTYHNTVSIDQFHAPQGGSRSTLITDPFGLPGGGVEP